MISKYRRQPFRLGKGGRCQGLKNKGKKKKKKKKKKEKKKIKNLKQKELPGYFVHTNCGQREYEVTI